MTQRFGKWLKYLGNGFDTWGTALLCWKWLKNFTNDLNM